MFKRNLLHSEESGILINPLLAATGQVLLTHACKKGSEKGVLQLSRGALQKVLRRVLRRCLVVGSKGEKAVPVLRKGGLEGA